MLVIRHDGQDERHAIAAMVHNTAVLAQVAANWTRDSFASKFANILATWCIDYFNKSKEAPGVAGITAQFDLWKDNADSAIAQTMAEWLSGLPDQSDLSTDYAVDMIGLIVQKQSLKRLGNALVSLCETGKVEDALNVQVEWKRPKIGQESSGVFPLQDPSIIERAFAYSQRDPLVKYPGALGEFFGDVLSADSFVSFLAPAKTGKTTVLSDLVWRAVSQGRRVAYFSCGDMSQDQMILRLAPRLCKRPLKGGRFKIPTELSYTNKEPTIKFDVQSRPPITKEEVLQAFAQAGQSDPTRFRLLSYPAGSLSVQEISSMADRWADEGWMPEIFAIDYADIMALPQGFKEKRDGISKQWEQLRALSTRTRSLVVTASQSDTEGYSAWLLGKKNFSDARNKIDNVTAMIGLNMTEAERRLGVCRYNYVALREAEFMADRPSYVAVAGCTRVGRPSMISCWPED